jgi:hypothetical protein
MRTDDIRVIEETLRELAPDAEIHFERLAVTPEQIRAWDLPMRSPKRWRNTALADQTPTDSRVFGRQP